MSFRRILCRLCPNRMTRRRPRKREEVLIRSEKWFESGRACTTIKTNSYANSPGSSSSKACRGDRSVTVWKSFSPKYAALRWLMLADLSQPEVGYEPYLVSNVSSATLPARRCNLPALLVKAAAVAPRASGIVGA